MPTFKIPLSNIPQEFPIELDGKSWYMVSRWNDAPDGGWIIDWYDADNLPVVMNAPLVTGADLGDQYESLGIPRVQIVMTDGDENAVPTLGNLGVESNLYLVQA
jgi:hypothetical protein